MALSSVRDAIKETLKGVSGIGVVHDYERWTVDWGRYLSLFKPKGQDVINGWTVSRASSSEVASTSRQYFRTHRFIIKGYYSQRDSAGSEKVFQDLIERVCDALRANRNLNQTADRVEPPQVDLVETRSLGEVLCHYCQISLMVEEEISG